MAQDNSRWSDGSQDLKAVGLDVPVLRNANRYLLLTTEHRIGKREGATYIYVQSFQRYIPGPRENYNIRSILLSISSPTTPGDS